VILNTAAFPSSRIPLRISACRAPGIGEWLVRGLNGFAGPATTMAMSRRRLSGPEKRGFLYPYGTWADRVAVHRFVRDIPLETNHPSRAALETIGAALARFSPNPKMILWGGRDFCFNDHFLARWRQIYPQAPVHRYDDVGHYVLEDAGQDAWQRIASFFQTPAS
jgi:cis-3-alkyl-4-acyloxetan-2-one decarboxylase